MNAADRERQAAQSAESRLRKRIAELLVVEDERGLDRRWSALLGHVRELALRPAKRIRPRLLLAAYELAAGEAEPPDGLWTFAAGLELLHTFLLVHDDIADRAEVRRGGPTLHRRLDCNGEGVDLAVVAGDYLFARAIELLLTSELPGAAAATAYYLKVCRHTAVGQYLDIALAHRPLSGLSPFEAVKVAHLKTAKYSVAAPLACGAMLAGASEPLVQTLERAGRLAGIAFQLRDDVIGTFGSSEVAGKSTSSDLREAKRTLPLLAGHRNAFSAERVLLESLGPHSSFDELERARDIIRLRGGLSITERTIERATRSALRTLDALPAPRERVERLKALFQALALRQA